MGNKHSREGAPDDFGDDDHFPTEHDDEPGFDAQPVCSLPPPASSGTILVPPSNLSRWRAARFTADTAAPVVTAAAVAAGRCRCRRACSLRSLPLFSSFFSPCARIGARRMAGA